MQMKLVAPSLGQSVCILAGLATLVCFFLPWTAYLPQPGRTVSFSTLHFAGNSLTETVQYFSGYDLVTQGKFEGFALVPVAALLVIGLACFQVLRSSKKEKPKQIDALLGHGIILAGLGCLVVFIYHYFSYDFPLPGDDKKGGIAYGAIVCLTASVAVVIGGWLHRASERLEWK